MNFSIVFLTGVSGVGKTTLLEALKKQMPSITCFHFDDIGIPSEEEMIRNYGSTSEWQKIMVYRWIRNLIENYQKERLMILEGQINIDFIILAFKKLNFHQYKIILVACEDSIRHKRLRDSRKQVELINDKMDNWANFLRKQALAKNIPTLDTTFMNVKDMVCMLKEMVNIG